MLSKNGALMESRHSLLLGKSLNAHSNTVMLTTNTPFRLPNAAPPMRLSVDKCAFLITKSNT